MMKFNEVATATLDQLTDELAAAGIASNFTDVDYARNAVYELLAGMGAKMTLEQAIRQSESQNEIVHVTLDYTDDITTVTVDAQQFADNVDCVRENDGTFDLWGWSDDMTSENEMQWRLKVTLASDINTDSDAYNTGYESAKQGESRTDCPYAAGTWDANNWLAGYDEASGVAERDYTVINAQGMAIGAATATSESEAVAKWNEANRGNQEFAKSAFARN